MMIIERKLAIRQLLHDYVFWKQLIKKIGKLKCKMTEEAKVWSSCSVVIDDLSFKKKNKHVMESNEIAFDTIDHLPITLL